MAPSGNRGKKNSVEADQTSPLPVSQQGGEKTGDQKSGRSGSFTEKTANLPPWETGIRGSSWRPLHGRLFSFFVANGGNIRRKGKSCCFMVYPSLQRIMPWVSLHWKEENMTPKMCQTWLCIMWSPRDRKNPLVNGTDQTCMKTVKRHANFLKVSISY